MTTPYSSSLLNQPTEDAPRAFPAPQAPAHTRSVTHVVAAPQPMYAPVAQHPIYVPQPARGGSAVTAIALGLVVVLVGAIALVGGYYATKQASPTATEAAFTRGTAMRGAFQSGRSRGIDAGREDALSAAAGTTTLRSSAARDAAYAAAFRRGERAGRSSYHPVRSRGYGGSRGPRYGGFRNADVYSALGQAQSLANVTGAPVDVEIY